MVIYLLGYHGRRARFFFDPGGAGNSFRQKVGEFLFKTRSPNPEISAVHPDYDLCYFLILFNSDVSN
jgi:hypothetical protein